MNDASMKETGRRKKDLERVLKSLEHRDRADVFRDIADLAAAMGRDAGEALLDAHPGLFAYTPALTNAYRQFVIAHDIAEASRMLKQDLVGRVAYTDVASKRSVALYNRQSTIFDHIDCQDRRRIVMVGCGRNPFTIFHFHDKTAVPEIVGLDLSPEAVETANKLAAKLGYGRVRVELCDGQGYDYGEADIVHVASMVSRKAAVVSRIADTAPEDVQIILWEPCSLGRLWAVSAEATLDPRLEVIGRDSVAPGLTTDLHVRRRGASALLERVR